MSDICSLATLADAGGDCEKLSADAAIKACDQAIRQNPRNAVTYNNRGVEYNAKGEVDRAIADHSTAIEVDPNYAKAYNSRCWLRATANRELPLALSDCENAISQAPKVAGNFDSRDFSYLRLSRLDEAITDYDAALKIDPKKAASPYGRGLAKN